MVRYKTYCTRTKYLNNSSLQLPLVVHDPMCRSHWNTNNKTRVAKHVFKPMKCVSAFFTWVTHSVDVVSVLQEQVVLDGGGQIQFGDHLVHPVLQEDPDPEAC